MFTKKQCAFIISLLIVLNSQFLLSDSTLVDTKTIDFRTAENNAEPTISSLNSTHVEDDNFQLPNNFTALDFTITNTSEYIFAGYFSGTVQLNSTNSISSNASSEDMLVLQTDFNGTILNNFHAGGSDDDRIRGMDIDPYGNLYLGGYMGGDMDLNGTQYLTADREGVVFKLDPSFNVIWSNNVTTNGNGNEIADVKWNATNSIAVVGDCNGTLASISFGSTVTYKRCDTYYSSTATVNYGGTGVNLYVAKLNSTGDWQWAKKTEGCKRSATQGCASGNWDLQAFNQNVRAESVWYDSNGDIVVQGLSSRTSENTATSWCTSSNSARGLVFGSYAVKAICTTGIFMGKVSESGTITFAMIANGAWGGSAADIEGESVLDDGRFAVYAESTRTITPGKTSSLTSACSGSNNLQIKGHISWLNETLCKYDGNSVVEGTGTFGSVSLTTGNSSSPQIIAAFLGTGTITLGSNDIVLTTANTPIVAKIDTSNASSSASGYGWGWAVPLNNYAGYSIDGSIVSEPGDVHVLLSSGRQTLVRITEDSDGDESGKYSDKFPSDSTQWDDYDGDGYGDQSTGNNPDSCVTQAGNSTWPVLGCPDYDSDGWSDSRDRFPGDITQWNDTDWDGYGDNQTGFRPDSCPNTTGTSNRNNTGYINGPGAIYGCADDDYDGFANQNDSCATTFGSSYRAVSGMTNLTSYGCPDSDNDGYNDSTDPCSLQYGTSWVDRLGCMDSDGDGISDLRDPRDTYFSSNILDWDGDGFDDIRSWTNADNITYWINGSDIFPDTPSEWNDTDGDGVGDNSDAFPNDANESFDSDNDSIGDNADQCKFLPGTATEGNSAGCPDSDGDGWADKDDFFDYDSSQWNDTDFDGFGDNPNGNDSDDCIPIPGTSYRDRSGCLDSDRDGFSDNGDICPIIPGDSTVDRIGCLDSDGDGISDLNDPYRYDGFNVNSTDWDGDGVMDIRTWISGGITYWVNGTDELPNLKTQQLDSDNDGYGDNNSIGAEQPDWAPSDSSQWEDSDGDGFGDNRTGTNGDDCISELGSSTQDRLGCLDTDGDGWSDPDKTWTAFSHGADSHTSDSTQHVDSDNDGFGNNATGNNSDMCIYEYGTSTKRINFNTGANQTWYGCPDTDSDGYEDDTDPCKYNYGKSWADRFACPDSDEDGISDENDPLPNEPASDLLDWDGDGYQNESDAFPKNPTQWSDSDGDNWGDNQSQGATQIDLFPNDVNSWSDQDGDGYADQMGSNHDDCELQSGNSTNGEKGCVDRDGDGWSDSYDQFMNDGNEWIDTDNDGYGDNSDDCPTTKGDSLIFRIGCEDSDRDGMPLPEDKCPNQPGLLSDGCPDSDDDGISDNLDEFPYDPTQYEDTDHDGLGDNISGNNPDPFPGDSDNDGYNNSIDQFALNPTQWTDSDGDGKGDNWADSGLNQTRNSSWPGLYLSNATQSDAFPLDSGQWSDADADGWGDVPGRSTSDDCPSQPGNSTETMSGCPDMDGDGIPDILDPDADGDGIFNTWEYQMDPMTNPFNKTDVPNDFDKDGIPDFFDEDDDNDGFPDDFEQTRGSDPLDAESNPLVEYGGGVYYVPGDGFKSTYDPDGIELSLGAIIYLLTSEFLAPLLLAPLTIYFLLTKRRKYKNLGKEMDNTDQLEVLEQLESTLDELIGKNKIKITHALLLRNHLERRQDQIRGLSSKTIPDVSESEQKTPPLNAKGLGNNDGYEYISWPSGSETKWYRLVGKNAEWKKWAK